MNEKYICSFCKSEYSDPVARAKCELECDEKEKQKRRAEEQKRLLEQKETRRQKLVQMRRELDQATQAYYRDYPMDEYSVNDALFAMEFPFLARWGRGK